jgi:Tol biopolymer transport system component
MKKLAIAAVAVLTLAACDDPITAPELAETPARSAAVVGRPQLNNEIVFSGWVLHETYPWEPEIWVVDPDGRNARLLAERASDPDVSPNGKRIAFVRNGSIWVMDTDGANQIRLTRTRGHAHPKWSPDGTKILFADEDWRGFHVVGADGSDPRSLPGSYGEFLAWAPDGSRVYAEALGSLLEWQVDGPCTSSPCSPARWTFPDLGWGWVADRSPEGTRVIYVTSKNGERLWTWVVDIATGQGSMVAGGNTGQHRWSPDGTRILFVRNREHLWTMDSAGCNKQRVELPPIADRDAVNNWMFYAGWSRSGGRIIFRLTGHLYSVKADGSQVWDLTGAVADLGMSIKSWTQRPAERAAGLPVATPVCEVG